MAAIKEEEALASVNHTVAEVDKWEAAHFKEDEIRNKVKAAKKKYEDALRKKFFGFRTEMDRMSALRKGRQPAQGSKASNC